MIRKKSKFLAFIFTMLPGAGHMYLGFMKTGLSFMSAFFCVIFLSSWLNIGPLVYLLPLIWFYSFFDCMNRAGLDEQQLTQLEDKYLFSIEKIAKFDNEILEKRRLAVGVFLLLLGFYLVKNTIMQGLSDYMPIQVYNTINYVISEIPQLLIGVAIVLIGIRLIIGKKKESEKDA